MKTPTQPIQAKTETKTPDDYPDLTMVMWVFSGFILVIFILAVFLINNL